MSVVTGSSLSSSSAQSTVSESTLVALLAARKDKFLQLRAELDQDVDDSVLNARLVAYASDQVSVTASFTITSCQSDGVELIDLTAFTGPFLRGEGRTDLSGEDQVSAHRWAVVSERRRPETSHTRRQDDGTGPFHGADVTGCGSSFLNMYECVPVICLYLSYPNGFIQPMNLNVINNLIGIN